MIKVCGHEESANQFPSTDIHSAVLEGVMKVELAALEQAV